MGPPLPSIELTPSQQAILTSLVNLAWDRETPVKAAEIADAIGRNPGTIRNQMQSIKTLGLVEGEAGPYGGYRPTRRTYEVLDIDRPDAIADVPIAIDGERIDELTVEEIDFLDVHHPEHCRAMVHVLGSIQGIEEGSSITVGPTPVSELVVDGIVDVKDSSNNRLILRIEEIRAPDDA